MGLLSYAKYAKQAEQAMNMAQSAYNKHQNKPSSQSHASGQNHNQAQQGQYGGHSGQYSNPYSSYPGPRPSVTAPTSSMPPPSLQELSRWFDYYDVDRSGSLDREEVVNALLQTTGNYAGMQSLRETVYGVWLNFDRDHSGGIDKREFMMPGGLGESLQSMFGSNSGYSNQMPSAPQQRQQQQPQYQLMRAQIPTGMGPGQGFQVRSPYTGQVLQINIPPQTNWVYPQAGGPPAFDFNVPTAPMPVVAAAIDMAVGGAGAGVAGGYGYGANNGNCNAAPQPHAQHNAYGANSQF